MVIIDGKQTVFATHFLASHAKGAMIFAQVGNSSSNFAISFEPANGRPGMHWSTGENGLILLVMRYDPIASFVEPHRFGELDDGSEIFIQASQQTFNDMSLVHFYILKGQPTPA